MIAFEAYRLTYRRFQEGQASYEELCQAFERASSVMAPPDVEWWNIELEGKSTIEIWLNCLSDDGWYISRVLQFAYGASILAVRPKGTGLPREATEKSVSDAIEERNQKHRIADAEDPGFELENDEEPIW